MTYEEAKKQRDMLAAVRDARSKALQKYDSLKGPSGLTPDSVKQSPEWKQDHAAYWAVHDALGKFNQLLNKHFAKQCRAERRAQRAAA